LSDSKFEFVIEITDKRNSNRLWPPTQKMLRGAWLHDNVRDMTIDVEGQAAAMRNLRDIPGHCVYVSFPKGTAKIWDPLSDPNNADLLASIARTVEAAFGTKCGPDKPESYADMDDDALKTWAYWARRFLDASHAVVRKGSVPTMAEIDALPGKVLRGNDNETNAYRPMTRAG